ncbi:nucleotidyl transferase AbiEii/AbiGii toxin family protein [Bradyrhizobium sp. B097]|uniref:nucleotidyl transferase AbiEii/AbiGii toxin family protein n=1 Tax=Bradyrhizobium sp. B097 TaxID=3140244 RepID=UPI003182DE4C
MNDLSEVIRASVQDRRGLFQQTGQRLACAPENVEKDFWVTWTLDALYNKAGIKPRLLFKGGTSLSKAFDLIQRRKTLTSPCSEPTFSATNSRPTTNSVRWGRRLGPTARRDQGALQRLYQGGFSEGPREGGRRGARRPST